MPAQRETQNPAGAKPSVKVKRRKKEILDAVDQATAIGEAGTRAARDIGRGRKASARDTAIITGTTTKKVRKARRQASAVTKRPYRGARADSMSPADYAEYKLKLAKDAIKGKDSGKTYNYRRNKAGDLVLFGDKPTPEESFYQAVTGVNADNPSKTKGEDVARAAAEAAIPGAAFKAVSAGQALLRGERVLNTARKAEEAARATKAAKAARKAERATARASETTKAGKARATAKSMSKQSRARLNKTEVKVAAKRAAAKKADRAVAGAANPVLAAGAVAPGDVGKRTRAFLEGTAKAIINHPGDTAATTARAIYGAPAAAVGDAVKIVTGHPGEVVDELAQYGKSVAKLASGDAKKVEDVTANKVGLIPAGSVAGLTAKGLSTLRRSTGEGIRVKPLKAERKRAKDIAKAAEGDPKAIRRLKEDKYPKGARGHVSDHVHRKHEAERADIATQKESGAWRARANHGIKRKPAERRMAELDKREIKGGITDADVVRIVAEHGFKDPTRIKAAIQQMRDELGDGHATPLEKDTRKVLDALIHDPQAVARVQKAVDDAERIKTSQGVDQHTFATGERQKTVDPAQTTARLTPVAREFGRPTDAEMIPPSLRGISEHKPTPGVDAEKAIRAEAVADTKRAVGIRRKAKNVSRPAEKRLHSARRRTLRAQAAEAEARGGAKVRVSQRDRQILRTIPEYVEASKNLNRASRELTAARKRYGNLARYPNKESGAILRAAVDEVSVRDAEVRAARKNMDKVRAEVYAKAEAEASKLARGEKGDKRLASLARSPVGALKDLEKKGGAVLHAQQREARREAELAAAKEQAAKMRRDAMELADTAKLKRAVVNRYRRAEAIERQAHADFAKGQITEAEFKSEMAKAEALREAHRSEQRQMNAEFEQAINERLATEGRRQPVLIGQTDVSLVDKGRTSTGVAGSRAPKKVKRREGTLEQRGDVNEAGLQTLLNMRNTDHRLAEQDRQVSFIREKTAKVNDSHFMNYREFTEAKARGELAPDAVWVPANNTEFSAGIQGQNALRSDYDHSRLRIKATAPKGERDLGMAVPEAAIDEYRRQTEALAKGWQATRKVMHTQGLAMLATSPTWMQWQLLATPLQIVMRHQDPRVWAGAIRRMVDDYRNLSREERAAVGAWFQANPLTHIGFDDKYGLDPLTIEGQKKSLEVMMDKTPGGRAANVAINSLKSGGPLLQGIARYESFWRRFNYYLELDRTAGLTAKGAPRMSARAKQFALGATEGAKMQRDFMTKLEGMKPHEQSLYLSSPKGRAMMDRLARKAYDNLGNYGALTKTERQATTMIPFYGFVRMSLHTIFLGYPRHNPIKAAILANLGQANAQHIKELLGGDPSFFSGWGQTTVDGKMLDLSRALPTGNTVLETLGGLQKGINLSTATRPFMPLIGITAGALEGKDNLGNPIGRDESKIQAFAEGLSDLNPITRKYLSDHIGPGPSDISKLFKAINDSDPTNGPLSNNKWYLADLLDDPKTQREAVRLSKLLDKAFAIEDFPSPGAVPAHGPEHKAYLKAKSDASDAWKEINKMMLLYGVQTKAEQRRDKARGVKRWQANQFGSASSSGGGTALGAMTGQSSGGGAKGGALDQMLSK